jgi:hypothetical protein
VPTESHVGSEGSLQSGFLCEAVLCEAVLCPFLWWFLGVPEDRQGFMGLLPQTPSPGLSPQNSLSGPCPQLKPGLQNSSWGHLFCGALGPWQGCSSGQDSSQRPSMQPQSVPFLHLPSGGPKTEPSPAISPSGLAPGRESPGFGHDLPQAGHRRQGKVQRSCPPSLQTSVHPW